jgi:hypothetical protein
MNEILGRLWEELWTKFVSSEAAVVRQQRDSCDGADHRARYADWLRFAWSTLLVGREHLASTAVCGGACQANYSPFRAMIAIDSYFLAGGAKSVRTRLIHWSRLELRTGLSPSDASSSV